MAVDSSFTFDTNITAIVREIVAGLQSIERVATERRGAPTGQFLAGLAEGAKREVDGVLRELKRAQQASEEIASGARKRRPNERSFAESAESSFSRGSERIEQRVRKAAVKAGPEAADVDLNAVLRDLLAPFSKLRTRARSLVRDVERAGTEADRVAFGATSDIRSIRKSSLPNLGTPETLKREAFERAVDDRVAKSRQDHETRLAARIRQANEANQTQQLAGQAVLERRVIDAAQKQARLLLKNAQDVRELAKSGQVPSTGVRLLSRDRLAVEHPGYETEFLRPDKRTGGFERIPEADVQDLAKTTRDDTRRTAAADKRLKQLREENHERRIGTELDATAVRLTEKGTSAAVARGVTTRQITPARYARDNEQGGTDFFQVRDGRARQLTKPGQIADAQKADDAVTKAGRLAAQDEALAMQARADLERRSTPHIVAAEAQRIAAEEAYAAELKKLAVNAVKRAREGQLGPETGVRKVSKGVFADDRTGTTDFSRIDKSGQLQKLAPGSDAHRAASEQDQENQREAADANERRAKAAANKTRAQFQAENRERQLAVDLEGEAVRLSERSTTAAGRREATTRQITKSRYARDNDQGGTDFFEVRDGRARPLTTRGDLKDATRADEDFKTAGIKAVKAEALAIEARAEQERRTAPAVLAAEAKRIAAEEAYAAELKRLGADVVKRARDAQVGPDTGVRKVSKGVFADDRSGTTEFSQVDKAGRAQKLAPGSDEHRAAFDKDQENRDKAADVSEKRATAASNKTVKQFQEENRERQLAVDLEREAVRLSEKGTAASVAREATTRQITKSRFARDNDQGGTDFFEVRSGRAKPLTTTGDLKDATNADEKYRQAGRKAVQEEALAIEARLEQERRTTPQMLAAEQARIAAERAYTEELRKLGQTAARKARSAGAPDTGVEKVAKGLFADDRSGTRQFVSVKDGVPTTLRPGTPEHDEAAALSRENHRAVQLTAEENAGREETKREREKETRATSATTQAQKELTKDIEAESRRGIGNNFLAGFSSSGFGSGGSGFTGNFDGLARSAGQAAKFQALYQVMGLLTQAASGAATEFLDMDDSVTELEVAMGRSSEITSDFTNQLQDFAAVGGFNVGEAMDAAASGIRAFRDEAQGAGIDINQMGEAFAQQSGRLAVLSKTDLVDAAGNLKAVASGFNLPKNDTGFTQVTDAVAGAKIAGGGDEKQIFQGLANSALTFKELGFSLNEAATILSKINAETDQSGQLIATRVSRLGQILQGSSGKSLVASLNSGLGIDQQIDTTAKPRDQIVQLAAAYKTLGEAQRQTVVAKLGGTSNARELIILLNEIDGIIHKTDEGFVGKGQEEFGKRLENVRAQLTQIQGNVKAIITNLAASGLAAPFVGLVEVLRPLTEGLREATQIISLLMNAFSPLQGILGILLAVGAALKVVSAVGKAHGVGNALKLAEARFLPATSLAREDQAERARLRALEAQRVAEGPNTLAAATGRVNTQTLASTAPPHELAVRTRVVAAELEVAAHELAAADAQLLEANAALTRARFVNRVDPALVPPKVRLNAAQNFADEKAAEEAAAQARANVTGAQARVASRDADLRLAKKREADAKAITDSHAALRVDAGNTLRDDLGTVRGKIEKAELRGDTGRVTVLRKQEEQLYATHTARIKVIDAQEIAEREAFVAALGRTTFQMIADTATFGASSRLRDINDSVRAAQAGIPNVTPPKSFLRAGGEGLKEVGKAAGSGIRSAAGGLSNLIGGPAGFALIGLALAGELKSSMDSLTGAQEAAAKTASQPLFASAESLAEASTSNATAASNLKETTSGFFGSIADFLSGRAGSKQAEQSQQLADVEASQREAILKRREQDARSSDPNTLSAAIDVTSSESVAASLKTMTEAGQPASAVLDALGGAIKSLSFSATSAAGALTTEQVLTFGAKVGDETLSSLNARRNNAEKTARSAGGFLNLGIGGPSREELVQSFGELDRFKGVDAGAVRRITDDTTRQFLSDPKNANKNLSTDVEARKAYRTLLQANLEGAVIDPTARKEISADALKSFLNTVKATKDQLADPKTLQNLINNSSAAIDAAGQEAGRTSKLKSLQSGTLDNSALDSTKARESAVNIKIAEAKAAIDQAKNEGDGKAEEGGLIALNVLNAQRDQILIDGIDATIAQAKRDIGILEKQRGKALSGAKGVDEIKAINAKYDSLELDKAVDSHDTETVVTAIENSDKATVDAKRKAVHAALAKAKKDFNDLLALKRRDPEVDISGAQKALDAAQAAANAFDTADAQAVPGSGGKPVTADQLKAAQAARIAAQNRDSLAASKAALDKAQADYDASKHTGLEEETLRKGVVDAKNAYDDEVQKVANSVADVSPFPTSAVTAATRALRNANQELLKYVNVSKAGSAERAAALDAKAKAERELEIAQSEETALFARAAADLTNPVTAAKIDTDAAKRKLAADQKRLAKDPNNADAKDAVAQDQIDLKAKQNTEEAAGFNQLLNSLNTNEQLGRITHAAKLRGLQNEHDRLTAILHKTKQEQDLLDQVDLAIKGSVDQMTGQFNLGDIKVPTVYEVRRSLGNSTGANAANSTTNSTVANTTTNNISINGADIAKVETLMKQLLGAGIRYTPAPRKA